jgi:hypothetical protein
MMLPTYVLNFRCIMGVEHFQKILVLKEGSKHWQFTFYFLINTILFFYFNTMVIYGLRFLLWLAMTIW